MNRFSQLKFNRLDTENQSLLMEFFEFWDREHFILFKTGSRNVWNLRGLEIFRWGFYMMCFCIRVDNRLCLNPMQRYLKPYLVKTVIDSLHIASNGT